MIPPMAEPDAPLLRLRRRREEGDQGAGDRGRPARRSRHRRRRRWRAARRISSRSAARWWPIRNGSTSCAASEPIRRCLACNTCIDGMRSGAGISCVVNGAAGRESRCSPTPTPPRGERIAVIGAGPAGLTYASLVADDNTVTVFEKDCDAPAARSATPGSRRCSKTSAPTRQASSATSATWWRPASASA